MKDEQQITSPWWIGATSHYLEPELRLDYHDETLTAILEQEAEKLGYIQERRSDMGGFEPSRNPLFDAWAYRNGEQSTTDFLLDISLWVFTPREGFPKFGVFNWWW